MKKKLLKGPLIFAIIYLVAIVVCIFLAFDFDGRTNSDAWLVLVVLTLPWSLVSVLFMWAIMHGAGLELFATMYFIFGLGNSLLLL